jgi:hypothetical protein
VPEGGDSARAERSHEAANTTMLSPPPHVCKQDHTDHNQIWLLTYPSPPGCAPCSAVASGAAASGRPGPDAPCACPPYAYQSRPYMRKRRPPCPVRPEPHRDRLYRHSTAPESPEALHALRQPPGPAALILRVGGGLNTRLVLVRVDVNHRRGRLPRQGTGRHVLTTHKQPVPQATSATGAHASPASAASTHDPACGSRRKLLAALHLEGVATVTD